MSSVLIIGGGLGGLFTGAFLAHEGYHVTILEKNRVVGGGLQCFTRHGEVFGTGMHVVGGFQPGGSLYRLCRYLGIMDRLHLHPCDAAASVVLTDGTVYRLPLGQEKQYDYLVSRFPDEAEGLRDYFTVIAALVEETDLFHLRPPQTGSVFARHPDYFLPADELIARHVRHPRLQELLAWPFLLFDGRRGHTPAYIHALVGTLFGNESQMLIGGGQPLADALVSVIVAAGGEVLTGRPVSSVDCGNHRIAGVNTLCGQRFEADYYVSSLHPCTFLSLLSPGAFPRAFVRRLEQIPSTCSAFKAYYTMREGTFPFVAHPCFVNGASPFRRMLYVTPPVAGQGDWAHTVEIVLPLSFEEVRRWESTASGCRGADYERWKLDRLEIVTTRMEQLYPGFRTAVSHAFAATPLSLRDWLGTKDGAMYGFFKDSTDPALSRLSVVTKIPNLFLTGQCIHLHGICGTPLTALETAETIIGSHVILSRLAGGGA